VKDKLMQAFGLKRALTTEGAEETEGTEKDWIIRMEFKSSQAAKNSRNNSAKERNGSGAK